MIDWILLLGILPLGLSSSGILACNLFFLIKNFRYLYNYKISKFELLSSAYIVAYPIVLSLALKYLFNTDINLFQLLRKSAPLIIAFLIYFTILSNKEILTSFRENINSILGLIFIIFVTSFTLSKELYSHQLQSSDNRFFIYSTSFFLLATFIEIRKKNTALMHLIPLITFSKVILAYYLFLIFFLKKITKTTKLFLTSLLFIGLVKALPRITLFIKSGDGERARGIMQALPQCFESLTAFLFGHGIGYKYNIETFPIFSTSNFKLLDNLQYDIHNFYVDTLFKNGFLYLIFYLFFIFYLSKKVNNKLMSFSILFYFFLSSLSAPTLIGSVEIVGFFLVLALLRNQNEH